MFESLGHFHSLLGVRMQVLPILLVCIFMMIANLIAFHPQLWHKAVWNDTTVPISVRSRLTAMLFAWITFLLFVSVHPLCLVALFPVAMIAGITMFRRDKRTLEARTPVSTVRR